jgi:hypothetical protein
MRAILLSVDADDGRHWAVGHLPDWRETYSDQDVIERFIVPMLRVIRDSLTVAMGCEIA